MNVEPRTLVELLHVRAQSQPDKLAYTILVDGERQGARLTYAEMDRSARALPR
jgi:non-ribosomal peptide synthetase component F